MQENTPEIHVAEASEEDIAAIADFLLAMWEEAGPDAPGLAGATDEIISEIAKAESIRARIGGPERRMYVAYAESSIVGFAATRKTSTSQIELAGIMVLPSMVGRHIGSPLLTAAIDGARALGFHRMTVSTEVDNERALGFYEARGFIIVGESAADVAGTEVPVTDLALEL